MVIPDFNVIFLLVELETNLLAAGVFEEKQIILIQEIHEVVLAYLYLHMPLFLFAEIEQFRNQFTQLDTVLVDSQYLIIYIGSECLHLQQSFHLSYDKRQRRAEFMRDVCKETQFRLVQRFEVFDMFLFIFQGLAEFDSRIVVLNKEP